MTGTSPPHRPLVADPYPPHLRGQGRAPAGAGPLPAHPHGASGRGSRGKGRRRLSGYSRFVALMKLVLPSLAAVILGVVLAWPQIAERAERIQVGFANLDPRTADLRSVVNPRYMGTDDEGQPYTLVADVATEIADNGEVVRLTNPRGDLSQTDGRWVSLSGRSGHFHETNQILDLAGDVVLYRDDGFQFNTATARLFLENDAAVGHDAVTGRGPGGTVESQGFQITGKGDSIVFTGQARLFLEAASPDGTHGSESPPGPPPLPTEFPG